MLIGTYSCLLNKGSNSVKIKKKDYINDETVLQNWNSKCKRITMSTVDIKKNLLKIFFHYHIILVPW